MSGTSTDGEDEPGQPGIPVEWAVDTAIGAVSTAGRAVAAVSRSAPGRAFAAAAQLVAAPLTKEGHEFRERAAPAAQEVLSAVTPEVVGAIDLDEVLAAVDIDGLLSRIDVAAIVARVDVDRLVSEVDVQAIVERVDLDALMQRIDIDALLERIDVNAIVSRVDVDSLVQETELGAIIARSTTGVASEALDVVRRQGVSLDNVVAGLANRLRRRDPAELPAGPPLLVQSGDPLAARELGAAPEPLDGRAGPATGGSS